MCSQRLHQQRRNKLHHIQHYSLFEENQTNKRQTTSFLICHIRRAKHANFRCMATLMNYSERRSHRTGASYHERDGGTVTRQVVKTKQYERVTGEAHGSQRSGRKRTSMDKAAEEVKRIWRYSHKTVNKLAFVFNYFKKVLIFRTLIIYCKTVWPVSKIVIASTVLNSDALTNK
jgi:hypothetical protein